LRYERPTEAHARRFGQPALQLAHRAQLARQPDFADEYGVVRQRTVRHTRCERGDHCQVRSRLRDADASDDVHEHVELAERQASPLLEHREQQREPLAVHPGRYALRSTVARLRAQCLDLHEPRPRAAGCRVSRSGAEPASLRACRARPARHCAGGSSTRTRPCAPTRSTPVSATLPQGFFVARSTRWSRLPVPSKYSTVSTMCSSVFGPATVPPLVTCPTRKTAAPLSFAYRCRRAAHSRTCPTFPGVPSMSSVKTDCIESTN